MRMVHVNLMGNVNFYKVLFWNQILDGKILSMYSIKIIFEGVYWVQWHRIGSLPTFYKYIGDPSGGLLKAAINA